SRPTGPQLTDTVPGPCSAEPPPLQWVRKRPITRPSRVNFARFTSGFSKATSKHCSRSNSRVAVEGLHGLGTATATPVMVMTTVSGAGWATSMLPPPVWVQPARTGVTWPWRGPSRMVTGGPVGAGGWAAATPHGQAAASRLIPIHPLMGRTPSERSPRDTEGSRLAPGGDGPTSPREATIVPIPWAELEPEGHVKPGH